jgi:hypothetical protein
VSTGISRVGRLGFRHVLCEDGDDAYAAAMWTRPTVRRSRAAAMHHDDEPPETSRHLNVDP